jgi:hypothetical protein
MNNETTQRENREDAVIRAMHAALDRRVRRRRARRSAVVCLLLSTVGIVAWHQRRPVQVTLVTYCPQILAPEPESPKVEFLTVSVPSYITYVQTDPAASARATRLAGRDDDIHVRLLSDAEADELLEAAGKPRGTVRIAGRVYAGATIVRSSPGG